MAQQPVTLQAATVVAEALQTAADRMTQALGEAGIRTDADGRGATSGATGQPGGAAAAPHDPLQAAADKQLATMHLDAAAASQFIKNLRTNGPVSMDDLLVFFNTLLPVAAMGADRTAHFLRATLRAGGAGRGLINAVPDPREASLTPAIPQGDDTKLPEEGTGHAQAEPGEAYLIRAFLALADYLDIRASLDEAADPDAYLVPALRDAQMRPTETIKAFHARWVTAAQDAMHPLIDLPPHWESTHAALPTFLGALTPQWQAAYRHWKRDAPVILRELVAEAHAPGEHATAADLALAQQHAADLSRVRRAAAHDATPAEVVAALAPMQLAVRSAHAAAAVTTAASSDAAQLRKEVARLRAQLGEVQAKASAQAPHPAPAGGTPSGAAGRHIAAAAAATSDSGPPPVLDDYPGDERFRELRAAWPGVCFGCGGRVGRGHTFGTCRIRARRTGRPEPGAGRDERSSTPSTQPFAPSSETAAAPAADLADLAEQRSTEADVAGTSMPAPAPPAHGSQLTVVTPGSFLPDLRVDWTAYADAAAAACPRHDCDTDSPVPTQPSSGAEVGCCVSSNQPLRPSEDHALGSQPTGKRKASSRRAAAASAAADDAAMAHSRAEARRVLAERKSTPLLSVRASVGGCDLDAAVDTGADTTCISEELFRALEQGTTAPTHGPAPALKDAADADLAVVAVVDVDGLALHHDAASTPPSDRPATDNCDAQRRDAIGIRALVVRGLIAPVLLGTDTLAAIGAEISFANGEEAAPALSWRAPHTAVGAGGASADDAPAPRRHSTLKYVPGIHWQFVADDDTA